MLGIEGRDASFDRAAGDGTAACPALAAWRRRAPDEIAPAAVSEVERAVAGSVLLPCHRRWPEALRGDVSAAVAAAVDVIHDHPPGTPATDVAMSCLLVHAARGDPTAALVLAHGLAALAHGHPESDALLDRAELWARRWSRRGPVRPGR